MEKVCAVYILTNEGDSVLYTGVTSNLPKRLWEHRNKIDPKSFTARYNIKKLVWYSTTNDIEEAIKYEKKIKGWSRDKKIKLIENFNPFWKDLTYDVLGVKEEDLSW
jgi:putative endonuclease